MHRMPRRFSCLLMLANLFVSCSSTTQLKLPLPTQPLQDAILLGFANQVDDPAFKDQRLAIALDAELADLVWKSHYFSLKELSPELESQRKTAQSIAWATGNTALENITIPSASSFARIWAKLVFVGCPREDMSIGIVHRRSESTLIRVQVCVQLPQSEQPICAYGDGESETISTSLLLRINNEDRLDATQSDGPKALRLALQKAWNSLVSP